jgi:FkbH-like protein
VEALQRLRTQPANALPFPVWLLCGFTPEPLSTFLRAYLQDALPGRRVEVRTGLYGDLSGNVQRYLAEPGGAAVLVIEWADLDARLGWRAQGGWGRSRADDILMTVERQLKSLLGIIREMPPPGILAVSMPTLPLAPVIPLPGWQRSDFEARLEAKLHEFAAELGDLPAARFLRPARLDAVSPITDRFDLKNLLQAGTPYRLSHASAMGALLARLIQPPVSKKGLITDLDDTVWAGILGDAGPDGVSWDLEHHTSLHGLYQQMLESLASSGVLVGVASKNDLDLVQQAFGRDDIILKANCLFPIEAHWEPKSQSVTRILAAWNIAADAVVFIDDSPIELEEVRTAHPQLECRLFPSRDPAALVELFEDLADWFGKPEVSEEDRLRRESLRSAAIYSGEFTAAGTQEQVLVSAQGILTIRPVTSPADPRALELINKTNQFNLTGQRYSEPEWHAYLSSRDSVVWIAEYTDKFGALGRISVLAGKSNARTLDMDIWVLSCRAFSRRIEHALLEALFEQLDLETITLRFQPTERNTPLRRFLHNLTGAEVDGPVALHRTAFLASKPVRYLQLVYEWARATSQDVSAHS